MHFCHINLLRNAFFKKAKGIFLSPPSVCLSVCPYMPTIHSIHTALFSEVRVRLRLVLHGVMGLKWSCGVNLVR